MRFTTSFKESDGYLFVEIEGRWRADVMRGAIRDITDEAKRRGVTRILTDARELAPPRSEIDRFFVGQDAAEFLGKTLKVAVVYREELINRFMENTAVNRGAYLSVFSDMDEAKAWLLAPSQGR